MPPTNMTVERLLDIDDALVSDEHPARDDGTFDYERCARLHNYLVAYGWMACHGRDTPDFTALAEEKWFFNDQRIPDRDERRELLVPSLNAWLDMIYDPRHEVFIWTCGLSMESCDEMFCDEENDLEDEGKARFIVIYDTADGFSQSLGVVYDQQLHRASFPLSVGSTENIEPIEEHEGMWFPLETLLDNWISLIRLGKVVAGLPQDGSQYRAQEGLWTWLPYCDAQVDSTVAAIERYLTAVESRMPADSLLPVTGALFTAAELDAAFVPQECFIRLVLTRLKSPRFKFIAPGLEVPHDKEAFTRRQNFTPIPYPEGTRPAVLIFAASGRTVDFNQELLDHFFECRYNEDLALSMGTPIFAGLYSEPTFRDRFDPEEAGFRLLLPFALRPDDRDEDGARTSDGRLVSKSPFTAGSFIKLFQPGCHRSFGGEWRSQRMERLFDRWTELIESGVWTVGEEGVEGGIETFRDAGSGNGAWRNYWIPPDW